MNTETTTETTASTRRRDRKTAPRPEQLAAEAQLAETTAAAKPALTPEAQARLEKERAKLEREEKAAKARRARIAALEAGEELPTSTRGLPPVVKMNELGATARNLHRAFELLISEDVGALDAALDSSEPARIAERRCQAALFAASLRDAAIRTWAGQLAERVAAGAANNDTLAPLGLNVDEVTGKVTLIEKPKKAAAE